MTAGSFSTGGDVSKFQRRTVPVKLVDPAAGVRADDTSIVRVARGTSVTPVTVGSK